MYISLYNFICFIFVNDFNTQGKIGNLLQTAYNTQEVCERKVKKIYLNISFETVSSCTWC